MIILLHILYIYAEYLYSCIVNRNQLLSSPCENETNSAEEYDRNAEYGAVRADNKFICLPKELQSDIKSTSPSDNLETVPESKSADRFTFQDNFEEFEKAVYDFETKKITFFPPVYVQRYVTVVNILKDDRWKNEIKKVVDIGCSELGFFKFLKDIDSLREILAVDIDKNLLQEYSYRIQPWVSDYMKDRSEPLEVTLLCGNVSHPDRHLEGVDAVVAIELIEHLYPPDLEALPFNIFGVVKPRIAIFTTPNEEFNVLFDNFCGFRHDDHKFEWTRSEFESWANNICSRFSNYEVNFFGIGPGPKGNDSLGCCSQGAVFIRNNLLPVENCFTEPLSNFEEYEVIDHVEYPYRRDPRSIDKITLDDAENFIRLATRIGDYFNGERIEIPLGVILMRVYKSCKSLEKLKEILEESDYKIEKDKDGDYIVIVPESYLYSEGESDVNSEPDKENIQFVEYKPGKNDLVSDDWDAVTQGGVSWVTDTTQLDGDKNLDSSVNLDIKNKDLEGINLTDVAGDTQSKLEGNIVVGCDVLSGKTFELGETINKFNLDSVNYLDKIEVGDSKYNSERVASKMFDSGLNEIQEPVGVKNEHINLKSTSLADDEDHVTYLLKHTAKFSFSGDHLNYDKNNINNCDSSSSIDLCTEILASDESDEEREIKNTMLCECHGDRIGEKHTASLISNKDNSLYDDTCSLANKTLEMKSVKNIDEKPELPLKNSVSFTVDKNQRSTGGCLRETAVKDIDSDNCQLTLSIRKTENKDSQNSVMSFNSEKGTDYRTALTVNSAYTIDECIESVQEKIKTLESEGFSRKKLNDEVCKEFVENSGTSKRSFTVLKTQSDNSAAEETVNSSTNLEASEGYGSLEIDSVASYKDNDGDLKNAENCATVFDLKEDKCIVALKNCGDTLRGKKDPVNFCCDENITRYKKSNSLELTSSNGSTSSSSGIETISYSNNHTCTDFFKPVCSVPFYCGQDGKPLISSESCNDTDVHVKTVESCVYDCSGKLCASYCVMCSSFSFGTKSNVNDIDCAVKPDESIDGVTLGSKNTETFINDDSRFSSETFLYQEQNVEKVITTHEFEADKLSEKTDHVSDNMSRNVEMINNEKCSSGDRECFKVCDKNSDGLFRSHSLGYFFQYPCVNDECGKLVKPNIHNISQDISSSNFHSKEQQKTNFEKFCERKSSNEVVRHVANEENDYDDEGDSLHDFLQTGMERQDSFSPDKAGDSGYPNSNSGRDMEMDLTPEQVKEIMTEGESSLENSPLDSPAEDEVIAIIPHPPVVHLGDNVENGDVANNNRDGEGNNMIGQAAVVGEPLEFHAIIDHPQEMPLMAVAGFNLREGDVDDNVGNDDGYDGDDDDKNENRGIGNNLERHKECAFESSDRFIKENSSFVSKGIPFSCHSVDDSRGAIKRSKTFLDKPSTFKLVDENKFCADKSISESKMNISCADPTLNLTEEETELNSVFYCNTQSFSNLKNWDSFKMVESYDVKELKKYASWLEHKSSMFSGNCGKSLQEIATESSRSLIPSDSMPSCSISDATLSVDLLSRTDISRLLSSESSIEDDGNLYLTQGASSMPVILFDNVLDSIIQDVIEELLSPNFEPFADWLLQIQLELTTVDIGEGEQIPNADNGGLRIIDEHDNDFANTDSEPEFIVEADVKGGGDSSPDP